MKKLKIAMLAPVEEQVPPKKYGGTELVVYNLTENLVRMGHEVTLFATGDSKTSAKLVTIFPKAIRTLPQAKDMEVRSSLRLLGVGKVLQYLQENKFDMVHNHIGSIFLPFAACIDAPVVTTFHGFLKIPNELEIYKNFADFNYISISLSQRESATAKLNFVSNVYNGIEIEKFNFFPKPKNYFAFLARISPEKGVLQAIEIAKMAGVNLIMAGKVDAVDEEFFREKVKPLIDGKQIKFIGEIGHKEKVELLGNAKGLLAPIQWEEPFGLYFVEAMICGTPVIANRRGSVAEIVIDGKTGFIVNDVKEAAAKVKDIEKISRLACHNHVKNNFSAEKMTQEYLKDYEKILENSKNKKVV